MSPACKHFACTHFAVARTQNAIIIATTNAITTQSHFACFLLSWESVLRLSDVTKETRNTMVRQFFLKKETLHATCLQKGHVKKFDFCETQRFWVKTRGSSLFNDITVYYARARNMHSTDDSDVDTSAALVTKAVSIRIWCLTLWTNPFHTRCATVGAYLV